MEVQKTQEEIKRLVGEARIQEALELLKELTQYANHNGLQNDFVALKNRYSTEINNIIRGITREGDKQTLVAPFNLLTDKAARIAQERKEGEEEERKEREEPEKESAATVISPPSFWGITAGKSFLGILALALVAVALSLTQGNGDGLVKNPKLREIQASLQYSYLEADTSTNSSLEDVYLEANPEFYKYARKISTGELANQSTVALASAVAGYGKTFFLMKPVLEKIIKADYLVLSLADFVEANPQAVQMSPDLVFLKNKQQEIVINKLPEIEKAVVDSLLDSTLTNWTYLIIDDFDEIHQNSCNYILGKLSKYLKSSPDSAKHVVVLGRAESFQRYLEQPTYPGGFNVFNLEKLKIDEYGDLELRVRNYIEWKNLKGIRDTEAFIDQVFQFVRDYPDLSYSFPNLGLSTAIIEKATTSSPTSPSCLEVRNTLIDHLFERAEAKHGRPSDALQNGQLYERAFEEVAVKYDKINEKGLFEVGTSNTISFSFEDNQYKFQVRDLLDRSGLIDLIPTSSGVSYYQFEPFWLHEYFQEKYNSRRIKNYKETACEKVEID